MATIPTLAARVSTLKNDGCFIGKLLNYDTDDHDAIIAAINNKSTEFSVVTMDSVTHLKFGSSRSFSIVGIKSSTGDDTALDLCNLAPGQQINLSEYIDTTELFSVLVP